MDSFIRIFAVHNMVYLLIGFAGIVLMVIYRRRILNEGKEIKKLKTFLNYIDNISYQYTISRSVEEAVLESLETAQQDIRELAESFYDLLLTGEKEKLRECKEIYTSNFYFQFIMYSYLGMEYGDSIEDSVYLKSISFLKKQVFIWVLNREKLNHYLSGIVFLILIPIQFLKPIEMWARFNMAELERYYRDSYGVICRFLLLFLTIFSYQAMIWLRENYNVHFHSSVQISKAARQKMVRRYFERWMEHHPKRVRKLIGILQKSSSRLSIQEFQLVRLLLSIAALLSSIAVFLPVMMKSIHNLFLFGIVSAVISILVFCMPVWYLQLRELLMEKQKEDETYFFYGIAQMAALTGNGDVNEILEWMELGSDIFAPVLQTCMEEFPFDNESALEHGKLSAAFPPFIKLLDAFKISEQIGLEQALSPLHQELEHYIEKRKQDNDIATSNKGVIGRFIAFIPMVCMLGLYLIVPFVLESLVQLQEYIRQIQQNM